MIYNLVVDNSLLINIEHNFENTVTYNGNRLLLFLKTRSARYISILHKISIYEYDISLPPDIIESSSIDIYRRYISSDIYRYLIKYRYMNMIYCFHPILSNRLVSKYIVDTFHPIYQISSSSDILKNILSRTT